jgi:hypothetical protein
MASGKDALSGSGSVKRNEKQHDVTFAKGGNTKMFGEQGADEQKAGGTAHKTGNDQGPADPAGGGPVVGDKFASGGSTKMFSFAPALPARDGITSAR